MTRKSHIKCPNCGYVSTIPREKAKFKSNDHLKNFYCPTCRTYQKHREINEYEYYNYRKRSGEFSNIKVYRDKRRVEIKIPTSYLFFRKWDELEDSLVTKSIILNSDYNLMETFLLNYINENDFRSGIKEYYNEEVVMLADKIILKFNISHTIYNRFRITCEEQGKIPSQVMHHILEYIFENEIDLEPGG